MSGDEQIIVQHSRPPMVTIPDELLFDRDISDRAFRLYGLVESMNSDEPLKTADLAQALGCTVAEVDAAVMELAPRWLTVTG